MTKYNERIFVDWAYVHKGRLKMTLDPDLVSERGRASIENNRTRWNLDIDESGHGLKPEMMPFGIKITPEQAVKTGSWLETDQAWEKNLSSFLTVIHEDGKYKCWYNAVLTSEAAADICPEMVKAKPYQLPMVMAYAESEDGFNWNKPELDVFKFRDRPTNIVGFFKETAVMSDPNGLPGERYKAFNFTEIPEGEGTSFGLYGCVSPDGFHWTQTPEPLFRFFHDTENVPAWDPVLKKYVAYLRDHWQGRAIGRSETDDFHKWPKHQTIFSPGPEEDPSVDYYTNCYTTYPGDPELRLMFPAIFNHFTDNMLVRLAVSRDSLRWNWVSRDPVITPGQPPEKDSGTMYAGPNLVRLPDGTLALPFSSGESTHTNFSAFYNEYSMENRRIGWATWRDGRLAGIEAVEQGEFFCRGGVCNGDGIEINALTSCSGCIQVALCEPDGWGMKPLEGFGFDDCNDITGDHFWTPLSWKGSSDLLALKDRKLILHFRMRSAKVFGFRTKSERQDDDKATVRTMI